MYFFLIFGLPIGFLLLVLNSYPHDEYQATSRAYLRGLAAFIPIWLVARILGAIVPAAYGSFLLTFHEWADRILPYSALPALGFLVFYRPGERLPSGAGPRRLTAFYAGALSPIGLCETVRIWGNPSPYTLFFLPILLGAICLLMPQAAAIIHDGYGFGLATSITGVAAATFAASLCRFFLLGRLWLPAFALIAAIGAGAWFFAFPELMRHPPIPFTEEA
jgi:hypothetical protein